MNNVHFRATAEYISQINFHRDSPVNKNLLITIITFHPTYAKPSVKV